MVGTNSFSAQSSQTNVGGSRVAAARKRVTSKSASSSASSAAASRPRAHAAAANQGILKFYTEDAPGLRIGPQAVLIMALVFMGVVVMLHIVGKIRQSFGSG
ncbi:sec61beta family protein [Cyclospora cayetanensis]|uniref:Protein transport protein Sec61 subunit beta n=1 Tax=Cyclospora cayetanensis TaxID=88456 RepID=A0A1D3CZW9_9EIME|nr:sec61beta family protein [Cyclospora cayetanensis]